LENGRIVQQGTHLELIKEDGLYRKIYELQARIEKDIQVGDSFGKN
jgi:ABC-type multidrug transport system fused ATPase/permease subunit